MKQLYNELNFKKIVKIHIFSIHSDTKTFSLQVASINTKLPFGPSSFTVVKLIIRMDLTGL